MGFAKRMVRKSVRKATPRTVRRAMHPVRTAKSAVTPRPLKQLSRAAYTVTNPLGAAENALIGAVLYPGSGRRRGSGGSRPPAAHRRQSNSGGVVVGTGVRAEQALESVDLLASLMEVQRGRFAPAARPLVADPPPPDQAPMRAAAWAALGKQRPRPWKRAARQETRGLIAEEVALAAAEQHRLALAQTAARRAAADAWWAALNAGEPQTLRAALVAAFDDNVAPVTVLWSAHEDAGLLLLLPDVEDLGPKQPHVTPSGRLSSRNWPKADLHNAYAALLGAHLLATAREAWAVGPGLGLLNVVGIRDASTSKPDDRFGRYEVMFDADLARDEGRWAFDDYGEDLLQDQPHGLRRLGKALAVTPWAVGALRTQTVASLRKVLG